MTLGLFIFVGNNQISHGHLNCIKWEHDFTNIEFYSKIELFKNKNTMSTIFLQQILNSKLLVVVIGW